MQTTFLFQSLFEILLGMTEFILNLSGTGMLILSECKARGKKNTPFHPKAYVWNSKLILFPSYATEKNIEQDKLSPVANCYCCFIRKQFFVSQEI